MGEGEEMERGEPGVLPRTESEKQRRVEGREKQLKYAKRLGEWGAKTERVTSGKEHLLLMF